MKKTKEEEMSFCEYVFMASGLVSLFIGFIVLCILFVDFVFWFSGLDGRINDLEDRVSRFPATYTYTFSTSSTPLLTK